MTSKSYSTDGNFELPWSFRVRGKYIDQMDRLQPFNVYLCCSRDRLIEETERQLSSGRRTWKRGVIRGSEFKKWTEDMFEYQENTNRCSSTATDILNYSTGDYDGKGK
tara:strand:+ start:777 stop:1100 length:324 start_codon:yes stop_codon:yes gene_type:complete